MKDWKSNNSIKTLAASNLSERERANEDYYATEPKAVRLLLEVEKFEGKIWECACGGGHLSEEMKRLGYEVYSTDLIDRGYGDGVFDFIGIDNNTMVHYNIITNPPYRFANKFIYRALSIMQEGKKLALFLPIRYLEGKERKTLFKKCSPKKIYVSSSRLICALNGNFEQQTRSAVSYAWFVWEKGFKGNPEISWIN